MVAKPVLSHASSAIMLSSYIIWAIILNRVFAYTLLYYEKEP